MVLSEAFALYARDVISFSNQSLSTEEQHNLALRSLLLFTDDVEISQLDFEIVRNWKLSLEKRNLSSLTIRGYLIKLRVVLSYLKLRGYDCLDPAQIPLPRRVDTVPAYITRQDVAHLIDTAPTYKYKAIISLLYSTGLRISELVALNTEDIKEDSFTVVGKNGRARLCYVDKRTSTLLKLYLATRRDNHPALFNSRQGHNRLAVNSIQGNFKDICIKAGLPSVHPHTLRHTFATELMRTNTNLRYVQLLMGHRSIQTTQMYLHASDADLKSVYVKHHKV